MSARNAVFNAVWILLWGGLASALCMSSAARLSATCDEPLYLQLGLHHWRTGSTFDLMKIGTMPLPVDVETFPLYVWERCRGRSFDVAADLDRILPVARATNLVFFWMLLMYGWRIARQIGGDWGGRLAVAGLCCEPNMLAHAGLATTDVAVAACLLAFCHHFQVGRKASWRRRVGVPALCYGMAILAKSSGLVFAPLCAIVIEFYRLWSNGPEGAACWPRMKHVLREIFSQQNRRDAMAMAAIGLAVAFVYCGCDWEPRTKFVGWAQSQPEGLGKTCLIWLAEHLRIFNNAAVGLIKQIQHNMHGHTGSFLLGEVAERSFWYYFPVALSIKSPLPLLALPVTLALFRRKVLFNWACLATLAMLVFSLSCRVQIGIRLQLALIALAIVGLSAALANSCRDLPVVRLRFVALSASAGLAWMLVAAISIWPNALCYVNEAWGGPERGYRLLSDSNYDWGQGLMQLAQWQRENQAGEMDLWYFGVDPGVAKGPFHLVPVDALPIADEDQLRDHLKGRYFAVGATYLYGCISDPSKQGLIEALRRRQPVARTGPFLIYEVTPESSTGERTRTASGRADRPNESGMESATPIPR